MELVTEYIYQRYIPQRDPLPFPEYLDPENKWYNDFWITKEGECVHPWEMNDRHLLNTVRLIHRTTPMFDEDYDLFKCDRYIETGLKIYYECLTKKKEVTDSNKHRKRKNKVAYSIPREIELYCDMWTDFRLYMLLRREIKLRGLEKQL